MSPWAATPFLQAALVSESAGRYVAARRYAADAIERDDGNWSLWVVKARIETKDGNVRAARGSLARARALNPLWFVGAGTGG